MIQKCLVLFVATLAFAGALPKQSPLIEISTGLLRGRIVRSDVNESASFYAFTGIPYAQPPLGALRFQPPLPAKPWSEIFDATRDGPVCIQMNNSFSLWMGHEDCLNLNVYTPELPEDEFTEPKSVMVWVHGGALLFGDSRYTSFRPEYLMEKNIVLVSVNYRLSVLGFLSSQDDAAQGNAGFKDIIESLRWVRKNIAKFGGNPNDVTIFGESGGGVAVQYVMQSPLAQGLIHKAISESGSSLAPWAFQAKPRENFLTLARGLGIKSENSAEIVAILQQIDPITLTVSTFLPDIMGSMRIIENYAFLPCIEKEHDGAFVSTSSYAALRDGNFNRIPYMLGFNTAEGVLYYGFMELGVADLKDFLDSDAVVPISMNIPKDTVNSKVVSDFIKLHFFDITFILNKYKFVNFISDTYFLREAIKSIDFMRNYVPVYAYQFSYEGSNTVPFPGTAHTEEMQYLFYKPDKPQNEADKMMTQKMTTLWTNFAKYGNPTPFRDPLLDNEMWPKVEPNQAMVFMNINGTLSTKVDIGKKHYDFWNNLYNRFGKEPREVF